MATRPLIKESLLLLNSSGVNLHKYNVLSNLRLALSVVLASVFCVNFLLVLIFNWKGLNSMESIVVLTGFLQVVTKLLIMATERKNMAEVINKMNQFWPISKYGLELQNEIESIYTFATKAMKFMEVFIIFGALLFITIPASLTTRKLPYPVYYPSDLNRSPDYEMLYGLETLATAILCIFLLGFDFLFISLIINITCELKIVKKGFENIQVTSKFRGDTGKSLKELYQLIEHHNLVLECIKIVREIYSFCLLNTYFYNMIEMCVAILSIIAAGFPPSWQSLSLYGTVVLFYMTQLYFYCATGQYLITESETVSAAAYNTGWWIETQPELRKALVLVIQRANKVEKLTAGGMFALNLSSFRKVTRTALSFFTLVNALYKDNK